MAKGRKVIQDLVGSDNSVLQYISTGVDELGRDVMVESSNADSTGRVLNKLSYGLNEAFIGGFGETTVGHKVDDVQIKFIYPYYNTDFDLQTAVVTGDGGATVADQFLTVSSAETGTALVSSLDSIRYRSGHTGYIDFTARFAGTGVAMVGGFDTQNGYILKYDNGTMSFGMRDGGVDEFVTQDNWSGSTSDIDFTKVNIFRIVFGYLGVASPVLLVKKEQWRILHVIETEGIITDTTVANPNFPVSWYVENGASVATASCAGGVLDGGDIGRGSRYFTTEGSATLSGTAVSTFGTFRNKTTYKTITNKVKGTLLRYKFFIDAPGSGTGTVQFKIIKNATLSDTFSGTDIDTNNSVMEIDTTRTYASGGRDILIDYLEYSGTTGSSADLGGVGEFDSSQLGLYLYPGETATITAQNVAGSTNVTCRFVFNWLELF